jgi:O-antigen ligase
MSNKKNNTKQRTSNLAIRIESGKRNKNRIVNDDNKKNYYLIPIFIVICIIPLIMKYKLYDSGMSKYTWFNTNGNREDYFLYYKQWWVVIISGFMITITAFKTYFDKKSIRFLPVFIPLAFYAALSLLSAVFSKYSSFSYSGSFDQFENVFALLGYCVIAYYTFLFIKNEHDLRTLVTYILIAAFIMSVIGIMQFIGHDLIMTEFGKGLIFPSEFIKTHDISLNFGNNRVYLTLFNPNYVGVYVALLLPIIMLLLLFTKKIKHIIILAFAMIGLAICIVGSGSVTGILCVGIAILFALVFMWRYLLKRIYITIPVIILLIISLFVANSLTDRVIEQRIKNMFKNNSWTYPISEMNTNDDNVSLTYNQNKLYVTYSLNDDQTASIIPYDKDMNAIPCNYDAATNTLSITDEKFAGITLGVEQNGIFYINTANKNWYFSNQTGDGKYYYINDAGKFDKLYTAPSKFFEGNELFASNRGYIWSRSIPLLKKYIILGSGPDTYTLVYPQNDYLNMTKSNLGGGILTKPHNLYLQKGIQTGVLSLIAYLIFYGMYFISSVRLYIKGRFNSYYAKVGIAVFIGTFAYMLTGVTNDSSITTAPVYWAIMGVGIAANNLAKPLILAETAIIKGDRKNTTDSKE